MLFLWGHHMQSLWVRTITPGKPRLSKRFQTWQCPLPKYVTKVSWFVMTRPPFSGEVRRCFCAAMAPRKGIACQPMRIHVCSLGNARPCMFTTHVPKLAL